MILNVFHVTGVAQLAINKRNVTKLYGGRVYKHTYNNLDSEN